MKKFDNLIEGIKGLTEKRRNQIAPHNEYSTKRVLDMVQERGDEYKEDGEFIFVKPKSQPCEYAVFSKSNMCIMQPDKPDWGKFEQFMKPMGVDLTIIFRKSDPVSKKKGCRLII